MGIITHYSSSFLQPNILGLSQSLRSYVAVVSAVPNPISHERDPILQLGQQSSTGQQRTMGLETVIIFLAAFGLVALSKSLVVDRFRRRCMPAPKVQLGGPIPAADFKRRPSQDVTQYELPPLRTGAKVMPQMAMALKKLDQINWLTLDANYLPEHNLRSSLLKTSHSKVVQTLPQSKAACHEVLSMTINFLTTRYPTSFTVTSSPPTIHNHLTSESFPIGPNISNPLEVAARLSMEDFNILQKDPESGEYCLNASATLFPTGWKLQERIGFSMASLHAPVPGWKEKLGRSVDRYFDHLSPSSCMERTNLFIQTSSSLFIDTPTAMFPHPSPLTPDHIQIRRERQTFTRLVETDAVLFTVRTFMRPLTELGLEETKAFAEMIRGWETTEMGRYKGSDIWGETALAWCDDRIAKAETGN